MQSAFKDGPSVKKAHWWTLKERWHKSSRRSQPALMTPCTPVSCRQRSTSLRCWMFPFANTGIFTACLRQNNKHQTTHNTPRVGSNLKQGESSKSFWQRLLSYTKKRERAGGISAKTAAHLTALMCSQFAIPVMAPFCSLVLPCTVKSCKINKHHWTPARNVTFIDTFMLCTSITPDIQLSPTSGRSGRSFPSPWRLGSYMWWARRAFRWLTWLEPKPACVRWENGFIPLRHRWHCTKTLNVSRILKSIQAYPFSPTAPIHLGGKLRNGLRKKKVLKKSKLSRPAHKKSLWLFCCSYLFLQSSEGSPGLDQ